MARRRHHKKHTHRRRRHSSMGAVKGTAMNAIGIIAGAVAGKFVANMVGGAVGTSTYGKYIQPAAPIVLGFLTPKLIKGSFGANLGAGMVAAGGLGLFQSLGVVSGVPMVAGYKHKVGLGPTTQNQRGVVAGMTTKQAAILTA